MDINVQELKQKLDNKEDFVFIDVREGYEYDEFNLGADLIPLGELNTKFDELEVHKEKEIVVYCRSGVRSGMAKQMMMGVGFKNVRNLEGGVLAWIDAFGNKFPISEQ